MSLEDNKKHRISQIKEVYSSLKILATIYVSDEVRKTDKKIPYKICKDKQEITDFINGKTRHIELLYMNNDSKDLFKSILSSIRSSMRKNDVDGEVSCDYNDGYCCLIYKL